MRRELFIVLLLLTASTSSAAQQTLYFKKDHIYAGVGGPEIGVVTPAPADQTAPSAPTGVTTANVTSTSVQVNWSAATDGGGSGLAGYKVYRQGSGASLPVGTVGPATLSFVDQGLTPATAFAYTVRAFDAAQNHSGPSASVNVTTSSVSDTAAPATPTGLTGYVLLPARNSVRLTWNRGVDTGGSGVAGYKVYRGGTLISGASPITNPTFDDTGLAYNTAYAYTVTSVDGANNASASTSAFNITTGRELLVQDNFNRLDSTLAGPWTVNLGSAAFNNGFDLIMLDGRLTLSNLKIVAAAAYTYLISYGYDDWGNLGALEWPPWSVWSQAALQPSTNSFKVTVDVASNTSAGGIIFYAQAATGYFTEPLGYSASYPSSRGFRALLQNGSVTLQNCSDLFYLGAASAACSTLGSVAGMPATGTLSVETNATTGNVKVYVNGALQITATVSTSLMTGTAGMASLGYYDYGINPITYRTAMLDNFILERN
jgi:hypothetical protein